MEEKATQASEAGAEMKDEADTTVDAATVEEEVKKEVEKKAAGSG